MIRLENISKRYNDDDYVIKDLNLDIHEGEICAFIGPSGCGKSTTLKMINRMIEATSGDIYINEKNIKEEDPDKLRMNIGYVIQEIGLLPHKTVAENIAIVPKLFGWSKKDIGLRVTEMLKIVGLDPKEYKDKYPKELSGGQMQRVGVVRAIAANPLIILMDEPFGAVDPIGRKSIQDEFLSLQKTIKKTICFVTHDIDEAIKMGDRIAIFNDKNIVQIDTPKNILLNPINNFVKEFIGSDRINKSYKVIYAYEVIDYIKSKENEDKKQLDSSGFVIDYKSNVSDIINIMINNHINNVDVENDKNIIGTISFEDLSCYLKHLGGMSDELSINSTNS